MGKQSMNVQSLFPELSRLYDRLAELLDADPSGPEREFCERFMSPPSPGYTLADLDRAREILQNRATI